MYQYMRPNGVVIKATIVDGTHVEKTIFRRRENGRYEFVASYDEIPIDVAKSWK